MYEPQIPYILYLMKIGVLTKEEASSAVTSYIRSGDLIGHETKSIVAIAVCAILSHAIAEVLEDMKND